MKLKITMIFAMLLMVTTNAMAVGFPVTRTATETATTVTASEDDAAEMNSPAATAADRQIVALLLWFFLGGFAGHRWYLGSPIGWNILFILTLGGLGVWWIIDGIDIITENYPGL